MEKEVLFRTDQHVKAVDFSNMQDWVRSAIDHVVYDGVDPNKKYTGLAVTKTGTSETTVATGRFYSGGQVFVIESQTVHSHLARLPASQQRIATIVVWGLEVEEGIEPRAYVIDANASPPVFEPREVTMRKTRTVQIDVGYGNESSTPTRGAIDSSVIPICDILLTTTGVSTVTMDETYALASVSEVDGEVSALTIWKEGIASQIDTLRTDMAHIAASIPPNLSAAVAALTVALRALQNEVRNLPPPAAPCVHHFCDRFCNHEHSDVEHVDFDCVVEDGCRFSHGTPSYQQISLLNPTEPRVQTLNNVMLPTFTSVVRFDPMKLAMSSATKVYITNYPVVTVNWHRHHMSRRSVRYGDYLTTEIYGALDPNVNLIAGRSVVVDQESAFGLAEIATRPAMPYFECQRTSGEPIALDWPYFWANCIPQRLICDHNQRCYHDHYDDGYWPAVRESGSNAGACIAQTFLNANNGWLTKIGLSVVDRAASGDINVLVCKLDARTGLPDEHQVVTSGVLAWEDMVGAGNLLTMPPSYPGGPTTFTPLYEVKVTVTPAYLEGGQRYAILLFSSANHSMACVDEDLQWELDIMPGYSGMSFGTMYYRLTTDVWGPTGLEADLYFSLEFASFGGSGGNRIEVQMSSISLLGGIYNLHLLAASYAPPGTRLVWEIQNAGVWRALEHNEFDALATHPVTVPLRAVFIGTPDLMPGINLAQSEIAVSGNDNQFVHMSISYTVTSTTSIHVEYHLEGWNAVVHTLDCRLVIGGVTSGAAGTIVVIPDPEVPHRVRIRHQFTVAACTLIDNIRTVGSTTDGTYFVILERRLLTYPPA